MDSSRSQWALVTGASSGLGIELATALAARRINLVLAARSEQPMQQLAERLKAAHQVEVVVEPIDLAESGSAAALKQRIDQRQIQADILINNAAFGLSGRFAEHDPGRLRAMLQLDILTMTELAYEFAQPMVARGHGQILLVASLAAYQPTPLLSAYGAAKAYVLSLGEALNVELAPQVGVTVLSPGLMDTGFFATANYQPAASMRRTMLPPARVARIGLDAMFAGKSSVIAGRLNNVMAWSTRLMSRHLQAKTVLRMARA